MAIKKKYLVEKRNILNEIRSNSMTLQELRFFSIYLAKINARDISTRLVRFPMSDFQKIMDLGRVNIDYIKNVTKNLLQQVVSVPNNKDGYTQFQLFKECKVEKGENSEFYVEIDAHDKALPLMFEFKDKYFTYNLWYDLILKSSNQLRMYEILKQYEKVGERILSINDLKELLGLDKSEYPRYNNFRIYVLDACQEALEKYTDIKFTYEPVGKLGRGGKVYNVKFTISHNENHVDELSLEDFIDMHGKDFENPADDIIETETVEFKSERLAFLAEACNKEFTEPEMTVLHNLLIAIMPYTESKYFAAHNKYKYETDLYDYLKRCYDELNLQSERREIKSRFGYLKKILDGALKAKQQSNA